MVGDVVIGGDAIEGEHAAGVRVCPPGWYGSTAAERAWYGGPGLPARSGASPGSRRARPDDAWLAAAQRGAPRRWGARGRRERTAGGMTAEVAAQAVPGQDELLDREALDLVGELQNRFGARRLALLAARDEREARFAAGERPEFPAETRELRESEWTVASAPPISTTAASS